MKYVTHCCCVNIVAIKLLATIYCFYNNILDLLMCAMVFCWDCYADSKSIDNCVVMIITHITILVKFNGDFNALFFCN